MVDTGPWIFGRKVMLPAGVVERIDTAEKKIYVDRTKDQIKDAPEYDGLADDAEYRDRLGGYYTETYNLRTPGCDLARYRHLCLTGQHPDDERDPRPGPAGLGSRFQPAWRPVRPSAAARPMRS